MATAGASVTVSYVQVGDPISGSSFSEVVDHNAEFLGSALDSLGDVFDDVADFPPGSSYSEIGDHAAFFSQEISDSLSEVNDHDSILVPILRGLGPLFDGFGVLSPQQALSPLYDHVSQFVSASVFSPLADGFSGSPFDTLGAVSPLYDHDAELILMTILRSLYSAEVSALVPTDLLSPKPPVLTGNAQQGQQDGVVSHGRSLITLNWTAPTENEDIGGEFLGVADGLAQQFESTYDPITGAPVVYEMSGFGGGGFGDTTLSTGVVLGDKALVVADPTNFAGGDFIQVDDGSQREYFRIAAVNGSTLELVTRIVCCASFASGVTTIKEVQSAVVKTGGGTDYTLVLLTGIIDLVAGQWTPGRDAVIEYATTLQDLDGYTMLRNPVLLADDSYANVVADGGTVLVSDAITSGATSFQETLTASENGETWYYYLYAKDDETPANRSEIAVQPGGGPVQIDMLPSIPQNLGKSVGDNAVLLGWDVLGPGGSDANVDGYNVYRNDGLTLDAPNLFKLNLIIVPKAQLSFEDSANGVVSGDRVPAGTVALPVNGNAYTYVLEAEDTVTSWDSGTQNQSSGQGAVLQASKTP